MDFYSQLIEVLNGEDNNQLSTQVIDPVLEDFAKSGLSVFLTKENFLQWINSPSIDCLGKHPRDLMTSATGIKELTSILRRIGYGIPI